MAAILHQITGPLQLAGLCLLLIAGFARVLVRTGKWLPSPAMSRLVVNRIFALSVLVLILGIGLPAIEPLVQRLTEGSDVAFHGSVISATGEPIANAVVNVHTIGSATTNALGQFDLSVPRSRAKQSYKVQVTADGYKTPAVMTETDADMKGLDITLEAETRPLVGLAGAYVGQFYGSPALILRLHIDNAEPAVRLINEVHGTLAGPGGSYTVNPFSVKVMGQPGGFQTITGPYAVQPKQQSDLGVFFFTGANLPSLYSQVTALPEYKSQQPCTPNLVGAVAPLSEDAYRIVEDFAKTHFTWKAGTWHLQLFVSAGGVNQTFDRDFTLSDPDVDGLLRSIALLKQCQSASWISPYAQDGTLSNFIPK